MGSLLYRDGSIGIHPRDEPLAGDLNGLQRKPAAFVVVAASSDVYDCACRTPATAELDRYFSQYIGRCGAVKIMIESGCD